MTAVWQEARWSRTDTRVTGNAEAGVVVVRTVGEGGPGEACDPVLMEQQAARHGQGAGQSAEVGADERAREETRA